MVFQMYNQQQEHKLLKAKCGKKELVFIPAAITAIMTMCDGHEHKTKLLPIRGLDWTGRTGGMFYWVILLDSLGLLCFVSFCSWNQVFFSFVEVDDRDC